MEIPLPEQITQTVLFLSNINFFFLSFWFFIMIRSSDFSSSFMELKELSNYLEILHMKLKIMTKCNMSFIGIFAFICDLKIPKVNITYNIVLHYKDCIQDSWGGFQHPARTECHQKEPPEFSLLDPVTTCPQLR